MRELVECKHCGGTGMVAVGQCTETLGDGRRCMQSARNDPSYFEGFPDRQHLRGMCIRHGNAWVRADRAAHCG